MQVVHNCSDTKLVVSINGMIYRYISTFTPLNFIDNIINVLLQKEKCVEIFPNV